MSADTPAAPTTPDPSFTAEVNEEDLVKLDPLPDSAISGVAAMIRQTDHSTMRNPPRLPRPICRGIDPDADAKGYYCTRCGYSLIETRSGWYRHGDEWRHPR